MKWLTGKQTQAEIDGTATGRSFRRDPAWCWDVEPPLEPATTIFHAVLVDGIWIGDYCLLIALAACWPETKHQRCLFHLQMSVSRHLTRNPRTDAGRALRALVMRLSEIQDEDAAIAWQLKLERWWQTFGHLTGSARCSATGNGVTPTTGSTRPGS